MDRHDLTFFFQRREKKKKKKKMKSLLYSLATVATVLSAEVCKDNTLSSENDYRVCWEVIDEEITLTLTVKTHGWIGFGISEYTGGGMLGADIAMISANRITDMFTKDQRVTPLQDDCSGLSDWKLMNYSLQNGITVAVVRRSLSVSDPQTDRAIEVGVNRIIMAYGTSSNFGYHENNRLAGAITFIPGPPVDFGTEGESEVTLKMGGFKLPTQRTIYACRGYDLHALLPDIVDTVHHITSFATLPDNGGNYEPHHAVLYACKTAPRLDEADICGTNTCDELLYAWAVGGEKVRFPAAAGLPIGGATGYRYLSLEFHYDNPKLVSETDNSDILIKYTRNVREHEVQVLWLGDPKVALSALLRSGIPPKEQVHYEMDCNSDCTSRFSAPTKIFNIFLHMHTIGKRIRLVHKQGSESKEIIRADYYDFDLQHAITINETTIQPGDVLTTHCVFHHDQSDNVLFGSGSNEEMCMIFAYSYPKVTDQGDCGLYTCAAGVQPTNLAFNEKAPMVPLSFGGSTGCPYPVQGASTSLCRPSETLIRVGLRYVVPVGAQFIKITATSNQTDSTQTITIESPSDKWVGFAPVSVSSATVGSGVMSGAKAIVYVGVEKQEAILETGSLGSPPTSPFFTQVSVGINSGIRTAVLTSTSSEVLLNQSSISLIAWGNELKYHSGNRIRIAPIVEAYKCSSGSVNGYSLSFQVVIAILFAILLL